MDYKGITKEAYNTIAKEFEKKTKDYLTTYILNDMKLFMQHCPGKKVLDLGSGPGRDALFLKQHGFSPLCVDISPVMVKSCQAKGLFAIEMDMENLSFNDYSFDGIWAYTSLLHLPKKDFPSMIKKLFQLLKKNAIFYLGMKEGDGEKFSTDDRYPQIRRFRAFYKDEELRKILQEHFIIIHSSRVTIGHRIFLNYLCRKL
jgi:SAM-dependent methyltransferase